METVSAYKSWNGKLYESEEEAKLQDEFFLSIQKRRAINEIIDGDSVGPHLQADARKLIDAVIDNIDSVRDVCAAILPQEVDHALEEWVGRSEKP